MTDEPEAGGRGGAVMDDDPYIIIVTGWRGAREECHLDIIAEELAAETRGRPTVILRHGKCKYGGVDLIADALARGWGWGIETFPAEEVNGRILFPARTRDMCAATPRAQKVLAFPGPGSRGTWDCLHWAQRFGIPFRGVGLSVGAPDAVVTHEHEEAI